MDDTLRDYLDLFKRGHRLSVDEMAGLQDRIRLDPEWATRWTIHEVSAARHEGASPDSTQPRACHFLHKASDTRYTFAFAPLNGTWAFEGTQQEQS